MKILIIGAKGTVGQALVEVFAKDNEVIAWDRDEVDIIESQTSKVNIQNLRPDLVINAAAYTDVDRAESEPVAANAVNGYAVGNLAKICKELDIPIVHYSTEYVFDGTKKAGYSESDKPRPFSAYGRSKFLGERELQKNTNKFYLIRLSRLFGRPTSPQPSPGLGRVPKAGEVEARTKKKSFVELMLDLAKMKSIIEVVDEEVSCPTYAPDLVELTRYIADKKLGFGIYHGANSGSCTWYGFAREIFKIAKINVKLSPVQASRFPRPARRPKYAILLNTKLSPQRPWQEALEEYLQNH